MNTGIPLEIAVLILAAGSSKRMGQPKQLLPWKQMTLLGHALKVASALTDKFGVVLGANVQEIKSHVPENNVTINPRWEQGMGSSLSHGIAYLESKYAPEAILVMVADQPLLEQGHYNDLILAFKNNPDNICSSVYQGKPGVPAIFPRPFFKELKQLRVDFGARKLMQAHKDAVLFIETKGELIDLDTPEDYRLAFSRWGK